MRNLFLVVCAAIHFSSVNTALAKDIKRDCGTHDLAWHIHIYEGCIAKAANVFERTGDAAESIATAAVGACDEFLRQVEKYIDCDTQVAGVGAKTMDREEMLKRFHDYGVESAIIFRSQRLGADSGAK